MRNACSSCGVDVGPEGRDHDDQDQCISELQTQSAELAVTLTRLRRENGTHEDLKALYRRHQMPHQTAPAIIDKARVRERVCFLLEELLELADATGLHVTVGGESMHTKVVDGGGLNDEQDLPLQADALVDLVVVAVGTGVEMGLPWKELWDDVQRANMAKERGVTKRGHAVDLVKPEGWEPPRTAAILKEAGWKG